MVRFSYKLAAQLLLGVTGTLGAIELDVNDADSIRAAAAIVAEDLMSFYHGDEPGMTPGILPGPPPDGDYYWWTGGAVFGTMLDYRNHTGDTQYDDIIRQALLFQLGDSNDYLPANWSASIGNDDQAIWGLAAALAEQTGFAAGDGASWKDIAQNVFDEQIDDARNVGEGGECPEDALRWQLFPFNNGYDYISSAANGLRFNLGAQLALLGQERGSPSTSNDTAINVAAGTYDPMPEARIITKDFEVYSGAHAPDCDDIDKLQFSYASAMYLQGSAYMYNVTGGDGVWRERVKGFLENALAVFFPEGVALEAACEGSGLCNTDIKFYKGLTHRWLASTMRLAPFTADQILPVLKTSAAAAVSTCTGGDNGRMCSFGWSSSSSSDGGDDANESSVGTAEGQFGVLGALISIMAENTTATSSSSGGDSSSETGNTGSGANNATEEQGDDAPPGSMGTQLRLSAAAAMGGLFVFTLIFL
ncbi:family 76 glycoside hydrolase [Xylariomycetidae sp. FL2044]|nr:family 76 glycoside hydrolase [Xylariomycetidae sp. FL2044]